MSKSIPKKTETQAWSVADFESERPHLTDFVRNKLIVLLDAPECRRILVHAPVKSGKREIVEYMAQRDKSPHQHRIHMFISAWHRVADEIQRAELLIHNMEVFSINTKKKAKDCIDWIKKKISKGVKIVLHLDECDFGTGERQILGGVYKEFRLNKSVTFFLYSATPQEVMFSGEIDDCDGEDYDEMMRETIYTGELVHYTPPDGYCGPDRFLSEGLVHEAMPFFYTKEDGSIILSEQGSAIISDLRQSIKNNPKKNLLILRLSCSQVEGSGTRKDNKMIYQFLRGFNRCDELKDVTITVNKDVCGVYSERVLSEPIQWSNPTYWKHKAGGDIIIFLIDQTASRSTELVCHDRIFAYHDFRHTAVFTTVSQAQERVNHYESRYGGFQPIRIYGHKKTFELSAGRIDYSTYMTNPWWKHKIDRRVAGKKGLKGDYYRIESTSDNSLHPLHNQPLKSEDADKVLQELSSYTDVKVSPRVRGRIGSRPVFGCEFVRCDSDEFLVKKSFLEAKVPGGANFKDPFKESSNQGKEGSRFKGYLREWRVLQFEEIEESERGWGITGDGGSARLTICYSNNVLGIAVRWDTGVMETINTLETFKSMYKK